MQCPKCQYEPTMMEMGLSPEICPRCSIVYEKYNAAVNARAGGVKPVKKRLDVVTRDSAGPIQEVVVTDIRMGFMSMVTFMVKWAFAAVPALVIIAFFWMIIFRIMRLLLSF